MNTLAAGISYTDLQFLGTAQVIATGVLAGTNGVTLIDPGPATTLPTLTASLESAGISWGDVTTLLITHIHLDHAGACGTLVRAHPALRVYVHEKGAPHMVNPEKLLASATRLYGADMDRLWGEVLPVPEKNLIVLRGGERLDESGRTLEVAYTPGHASHHVSYFIRDAGIAFVGDTAGIKIPGGEVVPATPPPDIDLEAWRDSLDRIDQWHADTLFLTHFGPVSPSASHLSALRHQIDVVSRAVKESLEREGTDEERVTWFVEEARRTLRRTTSEANARRYEFADRIDLNWLGLARYWRKKGS